jgi:hypothetical protein
MKTSRLPIGIQNLREIIEDKCAYVDKTPFIEELLSGGKYYFLSRPRRFGKSLFLDTLKEFFEGNDKLFKNLYIHDKWDWNKQYPVVKIDFAAGVLRNREELDIHIFEILKENQRRLGLEGEMSSISGGFKEIIRQAHEKYGKRVVILVDEYDKPILDNIERPHVTAEMRDGVKNLYSVMKNQDSHIRFAFMTGVSKFSKVSLFSGINQFKDITLSRKFATICGYAQNDLETTFAKHLEGVDWEELKRWYNGYSFLGEPVYNPYDILLFLSEDHDYRNYWFETGSPSFLIKLFQKKRYFLPDLEDIKVNEELLDSFDVDRINPITLLFQSGYLTISKSYKTLGESVFRLKVPNHEVRVALSNQLIGGYTDIVEQRLKYKESLFDTMKEGDLDGMIATIKRLFAAIPWRNFTKNKLPEAEGYYASVLYAFFASLNATIIPEDISNHGQVDMTIKLEGYIYVIEIKMEQKDSPIADSTENLALKQIQQRNYSEKYRNEAKKGLIEVGLVFSGQKRNLIQADWLELE